MAKSLSSHSVIAWEEYVSAGLYNIDFSMPERLGANYIGEDGEKKVPVMIHRAILGSFERFLGILLEEYYGNLPLWIAPVQVVVIGVAARHHHYAEKVYP